MPRARQPLAGAAPRPASPRVSHPSPATCSLLKLIFDVPLAQAFLMEEHEAYSVPNSAEEPWAAFPRW